MCSTVTPTTHESSHTTQRPAPHLTHSLRRNRQVRQARTCPPPPPWEVKWRRPVSTSASAHPRQHRNCHIRALSLGILIPGAAPFRLFLRGPASGSRGSSRKRGQTSPHGSAYDATLGLAEAEPIVQAPHTRGGTAAIRSVVGAAASDDDHSVIVLVVLAGAATGPPGDPDALAFVGMIMSPDTRLAPFVGSSSTSLPATPPQQRKVKLTYTNGEGTPR
ncbi:hypothetical protein EDB89DRAFT_2078608 [Lactarius sanguifluus]|nr:hypothetical protein EDB89DRAFT_2078608 [Lactarius sanguifluus]